MTPVQPNQPLSLKKHQTGEAAEFWQQGIFGFL